MNFHVRANFLVFLFVSALFCGGCRKTNRFESAVVEYVDLQPKQVTSEKKLGLKGELLTISVEHDSRGYPKVQFILPLDVFTKKDLAKGEKAVFRPQCLLPLDGKLKIGEIKCVKGTYAKKDVLVKNIDQMCYRDPEFDTIKSKESLNLPDCKTSEVIVFPFDPEIRVDTEAR